MPSHIECASDSWLHERAASLHTAVVGSGAAIDVRGDRAFWLWKVLAWRRRTQSLVQEVRFNGGDRAVSRRK